MLCGDPRPLLSPGLLQATRKLGLCPSGTRDEEAGVVASAEREVFHCWGISFLALELWGLQKLQVIGHAPVLQV